MTPPDPPSTPLAADEAHLAALGYGGDFHRSMSLWSNLALGFTYLSPLVGVYSVLAALRQRLRGWRPAGLWNLGSAGMAVNVAALAYGIFAMFLLARPGAGDTFLDRWIVIIGAILVFTTGLAYMLIAKPYDRSEGVPEGDAVEVAAQLRSLREQSPAG
jgi:hypothetical protein